MSVVSPNALDATSRAKHMEKETKLGVAAGPFFQEAPRLSNQFLADSRLRRLLQRLVPADALASIEADLELFGERVVSDVLAMSQNADAHEPVLVPFDPWGNRIDEIRTSAGWQALEKVSAEEGLVAIGYERKLGEFSRLHQFAKLYLFHPSSSVFTCPLAMTDGAAKLFETMGEKQLLEGPYRRLISRDPKQFWTSGQWMTERTGGSDVGSSRTVARRIGTGSVDYSLTGDKWFTSATTANMACTLARIANDDGMVPLGSRGLSLFYLETRDSMGRYNGITIERLKEKLGTRAMPTAELALRDTRARLVGEPGQGVKNIAIMMNVTRIYNAICAVGTLRRGMALARNYAHQREAFGKRLSQQPLHAETLAKIETELAAGFLFVFDVVSLLGKEEAGSITANELALLRLLTPLVKLFTAKQTVAGTSEVLESLGGAGYIEDTGFPRLLRDCQVLPIWEGTTNILSLDMLRALESADAFRPFLENVENRLAKIESASLRASVLRVKKGLDQLIDGFSTSANHGVAYLQSVARALALSMARLYAGMLLLEQADWELKLGERRGEIVAKRWCHEELVVLPHHHTHSLEEAFELMAE